MNGKIKLKLVKLQALLLTVGILLCGCRANVNPSTSGSDAASTDIDKGFKITYYVDGKIYTTSYYNEGEAISLPQSPKKDGYSFIGWDQELNGTMPSHDIALNASFEANSYKISYTLNKESYLEKTYPCGNAIDSVTPEYDEDSYIFSGWSGIGAVMPSHDVEAVGYLYRLDEIQTIDLSHLANGKVLTLSGDSIYMLTGKAENAQISIEGDSNKEAIVILNNASISYLGNGGAICCSEKDSLKLILANGSENYISDSQSNTSNGAVYIRSADLNISGSGKLYVQSHSSGIFNTKELTINGCDISVVSDSKGIVSKKGLNISNSTINIKSIEDGIRSKGQTDDSGSLISETGYIAITNSDITISSGKDGIQAEWYMTALDDKFNITSSGDGITASGVVYVSESDVTITSGNGSTGDISYDTTGEKISTKGIRSDQSVIVNGGRFKINSLDSAIKADICINISGGEFSLTSAASTIKAENDSEDIGSISISCESIDITTKKHGIYGAEIVNIQGGKINIITSGEEVASSSDDSASSSSHLSSSKASSTASSSTFSSRNALASLSSSSSLSTSSSKASPSYSSPQTNAFSVSSSALAVSSSAFHASSLSSPENDDADRNMQDGASFKGGMMPQWESSNISISSKGIKAGRHINIGGGDITIKSSGHSISSDGTLVVENEPSLDLDAYYSGANSKGIKAAGRLTITGGSINISRSYEGIESKDTIDISGGNIKLKASDDGMNAEKLISYSGGEVFIDADGDGIDSNGDIEISGGTIIVAGPTSNMDGALDCGDFGNHIAVTGGILLAYGSSGMAEYPSSSVTTQNTIGIGTQLNAGSILCLRDESGNDIITFEVLKDASSICISTPDIKTGSKYTVYSKGTCTGTAENGIYSINGVALGSDEARYEGGTELETLEIKSTVTLGSGASGMGGFGGIGEGGMGNGGMGNGSMGGDGMNGGMGDGMGGGGMGGFGGDQSPRPDGNKDFAPDGNKDFNQGGSFDSNKDFRPGKDQDFNQGESFDGSQDGNQGLHPDEDQGFRPSGSPDGIGNMNDTPETGDSPPDMPDNMPNMPKRDSMPEKDNIPERDNIPDAGNIPER